MGVAKISSSYWHVWANNPKNYPLTFFPGRKISDEEEILALDDYAFLSGSFSVGSNQIRAYDNADRLLEYLEEHYGLVIDEPVTEEPENV
jgi:hypothetical protein